MVRKKVKTVLKKESWKVRYAMGPDAGEVSFSVLARGPTDARFKGDRAMAKEWNSMIFSWSFIDAKKEGGN